MEISINQWLSAALNPTVSSWVFHPGESEGEKQAGVSCAAQDFQSYCNTNPGQEANMFMTKHIFDGLNEKETEYNAGEISQGTQKSEDRNLLSSQLPKSTAPAKNCTASHTPLSPLLKEGMGVCIQVETTGEGTVPIDSTSYPSLKLRNTSTEGQKNDASRDTQDSKSKIQNDLTKPTRAVASAEVIVISEKDAFPITLPLVTHPYHISPQQEKENQQVNVPAIGNEPYGAITQSAPLQFITDSAIAAPETSPDATNTNSSTQQASQESGFITQDLHGQTSLSMPPSALHRTMGGTDKFYLSVPYSRPRTPVGLASQLVRPVEQQNTTPLLASNGRPSFTEPDTAPLIKQVRTDERSAGIVEPRNFNNGISDRLTVMSNAKPPKVELSEIGLLDILQNENNKNAQPSPTLLGVWGQGPRVEGQEASVLKLTAHDFRLTTLALSLLNQLQKQVHTTESVITVKVATNQNVIASNDTVEVGEVVANEAKDNAKASQTTVPPLNLPKNLTNPPIILADMDNIKPQNTPSQTIKSKKMASQELGVLKTLDSEPSTHDPQRMILVQSLLNQLQQQINTTESEIPIKAANNQNLSVTNDMVKPTEVIANEANNKTKAQQISVSLLNMNDIKSQNIPSHTVESRGESQESRVLTPLTHDSPLTTLALSLLNQLQKQVHTTESVITVKVATDQNIVASNDTVEVGEVIANEAKDNAKASQTTIPPLNLPKNLTNPPIILADMDNIKPQNTPSQNIDKQIVSHQETPTEHTSAKEHIKNMQPENAVIQPNVNKFNKEFNAPVYGDDSGGESQELRVINQDSRLVTQGSELKPHDLVKTVDLSLPKEKPTLDNMHRDLPANLITNDQYASTSISTLEEFDRQSLKDVPKTNNANQTLESHYNSIIEQIAQKMRIHLREGKWDMNLRLDPPELGHIKLKFTIKGNRLEAQIEVEKLNVMYAIERDIPRLKESISSAGIDIGRLNVLCHEKSDDHHSPYFTYHTNPETQDSIEEDTNIESVEKADKRLVTTGINDALDIGRIDYIA